jgi:hypothetical protein
VLLQLAETDAAEVLRLALPSNVRRSFPARVRAYLEEHIDVEGTLEIVDEDGASDGRTRYRLDTVIGTLTLHFARQDEQGHLSPGPRVRVKGIRVGQTLAAREAPAASSW